ncbi:hypothetical protein PEX2_010410 [Penicillium expansum]|uniref:Uncharacterized protein n=1 Tax=Penicillium expansum TaxID=27334 RepID=A0A0A2J811_PENEN|nr:hypothetical protein PEX2_010410 [Penicillium expansum]KGO51474.1 hypothetical protein PEX2_010410 [Penicillium expansum]
MSSPAARPAFNFYADVRGQLEAGGLFFIALSLPEHYFDPFIAIPGTRAYIQGIPGFIPALVATASYVETEDTEIVLGEQSRFESIVEMITQDSEIINVSISASLMITAQAIDIAQHGGRATLGFACFTFYSEHERYQSLGRRTLVGRGQLLMGADTRLYLEYSVSEIVSAY